MTNHGRAVQHLKRSDPVLAAVIERVGKCALKLRTEGTHFASLTRSIIYQQLSGKAAGTIHGRFASLFDGGAPAAKPLLAMSDEQLRSVGLSRQKIGYLRDLAAKTARDEAAVESVHQLDDDAIIETLTAVKGVGRWTVQMFLMFRLGRLDVLPDGDLGIRKAIKVAYRMRSMPSPKRVQAIGAKWQPYRTVACWYLWRSLDGDAE